MYRSSAPPANPRAHSFVCSESIRGRGLVGHAEEVVSAEMSTDMPDVSLRPLGPGDALAMHSIKVRNRERLARLGDWDIPADLSVEDVLAEVTQPPHDKLTYGIWEKGRLVGQISITPARAPHWAIGYFLDKDATGRGIATAACRAMGDEARRRGAVDLYAIVTHGNDASCAVLRRAGYTEIENCFDSTRWWLSLTEDPEPPVMT